MTTDIKADISFDTATSSSVVTDLPNSVAGGLAVGSIVVSSLLKEVGLPSEAIVAILEAYKIGAWNVLQQFNSGMPITIAMPGFAPGVAGGVQ